MVFDKVSYAYNDGVSSYQIYYNGYNFLGVAQCHDDDMEFSSERVGLTIAEARANIKVLCFIRDCEVKPKLDVLQHMYHNMTTSKHFNINSYEAKMVRSQIRTIEKELTTINNALADERKFLKDYIDGKEKLYKKLRAKNK